MIVSVKCAEIIVNDALGLREDLDAFYLLVKK